MEINIGFLTFQCLNIVLLAAWFILVLLALLRLRKEDLREEIEIIWAIIILLIPVFGALAFLIVRSRRRK